MILTNRDLRLAAAGRGIKLWQIAEEMGILDSNLSRKLRHELSESEKARIMEIIERLAREQTNESAG